MIVLGAGFGDEGKGLTTSFLCSQLKNPIVVRFNGGQQAGHTVVHNGKRHIFSNFGSGTLQNISTLWSHFCTFHPQNFCNEIRELENPKIFVHALCPVTTPYDVLFNRSDVTTKKNGTCGMGFGATLKRHESFYKLFVQDLFFDQILLEKLKRIADYYGNPDVDLHPFLNSVMEIRNRIDLIKDYSILQEFEPVFEGAQGILLDQDFGFFPNVTRSNTTSKNALSIYPGKEIFYVTRTYQTRHGNGFMSNEDKIPSLKNDELETNITNEHQGIFRKSVLDLDLLEYSFQCDHHFSKDHKKNLMITCVDQTGENIEVTRKGNLLKLNVNELIHAFSIKFEAVFLSYGPSAEDVKQIL